MTANNMKLLQFLLCDPDVKLAKKRTDRHSEIIRGIFCDSFAI